MTKPTPHGEPMAWMTFTEEGDPDMVFLDRLEACQYCEDDDPPKPLYLAAPPTAQAEGWTTTAQGFRDGAASLAASVDSELVYQARYQKGFWQDSSRERNEYLQNPENTCAEDWETRILYTRPPAAQAEGWRPIETAPKGERVLLWSEITRGEPFIGDWAEYARYNHPQFTHWSRWDGLPPTSAEGVEHG